MQPFSLLLSPNIFLFQRIETQWQCYALYKKCCYYYYYYIYSHVEPVADTCWSLRILHIPDFVLKRRRRKKSIAMNKGDYHSS